MVAALVNILYPSGPSFDMEYYLDKHMSIVTESWKSFGFQGYEIIVFEPGQKYQVQAVLKWDSMASYDEAHKAPVAAAVFGDIPKFTEAKPDVVKGNIIDQKSFR